MNKMNCDNSLRLNLLLDNELPETEANELLAHIETCEICAGQWRELQATSGLFNTHDDALTMSPQAVANIHQAVDGAMGRLVIERIAYRLASVAALVVIAAGLWIIRPTSPTTTPVVAKTSITVPETMETVALKLTDDTSAASADIAVATWMVADLSSMTSSQLR